MFHTVHISSSFQNFTSLKMVRPTKEGGKGKGKGKGKKATRVSPRKRRNEVEDSDSERDMEEKL